MKNKIPFLVNIRRGQPLAIGILTFLLTFVLTQSLSFMRYRIKTGEEEKRLRQSLTSAAGRLNVQLSESLAATYTLNYLIQHYGIPGNFEQVGKGLLKSSPHIQAIEVVEQGVIKKIHPLSGNESVIGYDILKDTHVSAEAWKAIQLKKLYFAGPLSLKQGGIGVVGRLPIFKDSVFWGFSAAVIYLDSLLSFSGIYPSFEPDIEFQLSKINPNSGQVEHFIKTNDTGYDKDHSVKIAVPDGNWYLTVKAKDSFSVYSIFPFALMGFLLSIISGFFAWYISRQPLLLKSLVEQKMMLLNENERLLSITQETAKVGSWLFDVRNRRLKINDMGLKILGVGENQFISLEKMLDKLVNDSHKLDLKQALEKSMRTGAEFDVDVKLAKQDGSFQWLRVTGKGILENRLCVRIYGAIQDVHSHKMSELERIDILESINDAFIAIDDSMNVSYWNKAAESMFHLNADTTIGKRLDQTGLFSLEGELKEAIDKAISDAKSRTMEWYFQKGDLWLEMSLYPRNKGLTIYLRDVSVHHRYVEAIKNQNRQMREIAWMQSHVVRAPLARLMGAVDLLNFDKTGDNTAKFKELINQSANELDNLIREISQKTVQFKEQEDSEE